MIMTTMSGPTTARPADQIPIEQMAGFLITHKGMRQEFGLLAGAAREVGADPARAELVEDQVRLVSDSLHNHHHAEDEQFWPKLRARAPEAVPELDQLEAEHERIDPLLARAVDTSVPLPERAPVFAELHRLLNGHLDLEERVAVPLMRRHLTLAEWEAAAERAMRETSRRRMPLLFGWVASAGTTEERVAALANVPAIPRVLFRLFWWPSYQRRARRLYGAAAPATVQR